MTKRGCAALDLVGERVGAGARARLRCLATFIMALDERFSRLFPLPVPPAALAR